MKGGEGDEEVDAARDQDSREEREREGADGILRLLRDVGRVLEADQGIESERRPGENREKRAVALLELEVSPDVAVPGAQDPEADRDDDQEPGKLDHAIVDRALPRHLLGATVDPVENHLRLTRTYNPGNGPGFAVCLELELDLRLTLERVDQLLGVSLEARSLAVQGEDQRVEDR